MNLQFADRSSYHHLPFNNDCLKNLNCGTSIAVTEISNDAVSKALHNEAIILQIDRLTKIKLQLILSHQSFFFLRFQRLSIMKKELDL